MEFPILHPLKNENRNILSTKDKLWWLGECGHEWETSSYNISKRNTGCPICANRMFCPGFNDLLTVNSAKAELFSSENGVTPAEVFISDPKLFIWSAQACGHKWQRTIRNQLKSKKDCPYCSSHQLLPGFNDLASQSPQLVTQWHPTKNSALTPDKVMNKSGKKIWWQCKEKHEWEATPQIRVSQGTGCPVCAGRITNNDHNNNLLTLRPDLALEWDDEKNFKTSAEVTVSSRYLGWWKCEKNHSWQAYVYNRSKSYGTSCPYCWKEIGGTSKPEKEIGDFLSSKLIQVLRNKRVLTGNKFELDIYLPEYRIAVEFNGLYWHSEQQGKTQSYHYKKWLSCKEQNIQLFQIWEDDWKVKSHLIERMLAHKLGLGTLPKVAARSTEVVTLDKNSMLSFLKENHIQGFASGSYYLGLRSSDKNIVAGLVLKSEANGVFNIVRYATSAQVQGGFTKLLKYAERTYKPSKFVTFSDNCVSDGGLYEKNGFTAVKHLPPDYMYVVKGERKHKFGYRLKKFKNDPNLLWEEGLTERELAQLNNIPRIWDAGKTKWEKAF